jgi:hypothetical protein
MIEEAEKTLKELIDKRNFVYEKTWLSHKFGKLKPASTTEKGDIGEDLLASLLEQIGYKDVLVVKGRRNQYDVSIGKETFFEVKVATQDTNKSFQFNGVRYDTKYTHLFCLGVMPDSIKYLIIAKTSLLGKEHTLTSMAKGSNATYKLTKKESCLRDFSNLKEDLKSFSIMP